jgi:hypothetical protein
VYNFTQAALFLADDSALSGSISGSTVSVLSNLPLSSVLVQLRTGYNNFTGPVAAQTLALNSTFSFAGLSAGAYSLVSSKVGYFSAVADVLLQDNTTLTMLMSPQNINRDMLRVILTWRSPQNLNLGLAFAVNDDDSCLLSSLNKECGGAKLTTLDSFGGLSGGESLTLKEVGPYQYAFFVTPGKADLSIISAAHAELHIYVEGSILPITRLSIPPTPSPTSTWLGFCLNGLEGITSLIPVQYYLPHELSPSLFCANILGIPEWISAGSNVTSIEASPMVGEALPNLVWQPRL